MIRQTKQPASKKQRCFFIACDLMIELKNNLIFKEHLMQVSKKQLKPALALFLFGSLFLTPAVRAESDQEMFLKAREMQQQNADHSGHAKPMDKA